MKKLFLTLMTVFVLVSCGGSVNNSSNGSSGDGSNGSGNVSISNMDELLKAMEADINALYAELQNVQSPDELKAVGQKYKNCGERYEPIAKKISSNMTVQELEKIMESEQGKSMDNTIEKFTDTYQKKLSSFGFSFEEENVYLELIGITRTISHSEY